MSRDDLNHRGFINGKEHSGCKSSCNSKPCSQIPCCCHVGPAGPAGPAGEDGLAATVNIGTVTPVSDTDAYVVNVGTPSNAILDFGIPKGPKGDTGPAGQKGERGPAGPAGQKGERGSAGPIGQKGERGLAGPAGQKGERGPVGPAGQQGERGPVGPAGQQGERGPVGPAGQQGDRGPIAATIPFSISSSYSQGVDISTNAEGKPEIVNFAGFGANYGYSVQLQPGEWDSGTITIREDISYPSCFIIPYNGILQNIHVLFANRSILYLDEGVIMRPFVCIAISDCSSLVFEILQETITYTEPYIGGAEIPKYSLRKGLLTGLNINITEGTLIGIVMGWLSEGVTSEQQAQFSISGGIFME